MADPAVRPADAPGDRYPQLLRTDRVSWWRPLMGLLLAGATLVSGAVVVALGALAVAAFTGSVAGPFADESLSADTPLGLLATNLVIAVMVPASVVAVVVVHRQGVGLLASVAGRVRWRMLGQFLALAFVVVAAFFAVSFLLPSSSTGDVEVPSAGTLLALLAVIALSTPLQAAAEEVGFRGYLSQAVAVWFSRPLAGTVVAATVSAVLFAIGHGGQDVWLFGDRLAFGLVASWLAWRTGGLEAPVALHVANNMVSLTFTAATGSLEDSLSASSLEWQFAVSDVVMMLTFAVLVHVLAGRRPVDVRRPAPAPAPPTTAASGAAGSLSAPGEVGYPGARPSTPRPAGGEKPWGMG